MSKPLNGCVRSHASKPSSSSFNPASRFAETHYTSLGLLVAAIASNDLDRLASQETNIDQTLQNLASALNVLADYRLQQVDRLSKKKQRELPDGVLATREDLPAMLYLLAGVAEVCAAAVSASANARYLKEHRGLSDEE